MAFNLEMFKVNITEKPSFIMMIGLPGSGKSTIANELARRYNWSIFSSDQYREKLLGDATDQSNNSKVFDTLYTDMFAAIDSKRDVIFDATNITIKSRAKALSRLAGKDVHKVAYICNTPAATCITNDLNRSRNVGEHVIMKFLHQFQCPQLFEGFDEIVLANHPNRYFNWYDEAKANNIFTDMLAFDQENPHHLYSLGNHCLRLANQCTDRIMREAGFLHDIGKLYTKTVDENHVAHYYNHDCVGAYVLTCFPELLRLPYWGDVLEAIFYVNYHMRAHNDFNSPKAQKKYRALFGELRFNKLMQFGEYDRIASGTYRRKEDK